MATEAQRDKTSTIKLYIPSVIKKTRYTQKIIMHKISKGLVQTKCLRLKLIALGVANQLSGMTCVNPPTPTPHYEHAPDLIQFWNKLNKTKKQKKRFLP